jgi:methyl-accepting chemotaxis protein
MNSLRGRIIGGLLVLMAFVVGQYFLVNHYQDSSREQVERAIGRNYAAGTMLSEFAITGQAIRRYEKEYFIYHDDPEGRKKYTKEWSDTFARLQNQLSLMQANPNRVFSKDDLVEFSIWAGDLAVYGSEMRKIMDSVEKDGAQAPAGTNPTREVNAQIRMGKDRFANLLKGAVKMEGVKAKEAVASSQVVNENFERLDNLLLATVVAGVVLVAFLVLTLPRAITAPIESLVEAADTMSKGKLDQTIYSAGISEFEVLERALERMRVTQIAMMERMRRKA